MSNNNGSRDANGELRRVSVAKLNGRNGKRAVIALEAADAMPPLEEILRKRRLLITGATGFLGKVLLYLLLRHHPEIERIYLLIRGDRKSSHSHFRREILDSPAMAPLREHLDARFDRYVETRVAIVAGDITEPDLISDDTGTLGHGTLDAVIHCAGLVNFEASLEKALAINTVGVGNVIEFCRKRGAALLHVSTCYAAGVADGHRHEDDIPTDWCPTARRNFNLQREIRDALGVCDRIEAESHDKARQAEFRGGGDEAAEVGDESREHLPEARRKEWVEERLKAVGRERAQRWGWPNTYSYTKSL